MGWIKVCKIIRIFNGCEVQIENSVTRDNCSVSRGLTVIPSDGIFSLHQTAIMDSFSCILFLQLSWHMGNFVSFAPKYLHFGSRNIWFGCYLRRWRWNFWQKMTSQTDIMMSKRHPDVMHESCLTPPHLTIHFLALVGFTEIPVGYARNDSSAQLKITENLAWYARKTHLTAILRGTHLYCCWAKALHTGPTPHSSLLALREPLWQSTSALGAQSPLWKEF